MKIFLGNSVSVTTAMELESAVPLEFEERDDFGFSGSPQTPPQEPVSPMATGSLQGSPNEDDFPEAVAASLSHGEEPAGWTAAGSPFARGPGEYNEPVASEWDDFVGPAETHALSDWPL